MSDYDKRITRSELSDALNRPEHIDEVFQATVTNSAVMQVARRLPNMGRATAKMSVLDALPTAYFVNGEAGLKKTTQQAWKGKTLAAEELAAIVPIPENLLADADVSLAHIGGRVGEAMGHVIDNSVLHGPNLPSTWLTDTGGTSRSILAGAAAASNTVTHEADSTDIYDNLLGTDGVFSLVEQDGYEVNGVLAAKRARGILRGLRADSGDGLPVFQRTGAGFMLDGAPVIFPNNAAVNPSAALMFAGDWQQIVYALRQDITFRLITEGVITDESGDVIYNLPQQDMVALRVVMRIGFQIANPVTLEEATEADRYPFAVLLPAGVT